MASILTIEDGTGVAGANSYANAVEARAYAAARGVTLPAAVDGVTDPVEVLLILAAEYLDSQAWIGYLATATQGLQWPRVFDYPYLAYPFYSYSILGYWAAYLPFDPSYFVQPDKILAAQCQLVIEQFNGVVLMPTSKGGIDSQFITREKTDVLETSYSEKIGTLSTPTILTVNSLLRGLLVVGGGDGALRCVRG